jgi:hypothetical protein
MTHRTLRDWLRRLLNPVGFEEVGALWVRTFPEVSQVVGLQKSNFGNQYYINLGIAIRALGIPEPIKEEVCHIRIQVEALLDPASPVGQLLDLDQPLSPEAREERLDATVSPAVSKFLAASRDIAGLRTLKASSLLSRAFVHREARDLLEPNGRHRGAPAI